MHTTTSSEARNDTPRMPDFHAPPDDFIDVGHSRLAYRTVGEGPDLFFVHGWPLHAGTYRKILPMLARHFTCHMVDLPGAGYTQVTRESPIDLRSHADTIERAIDAIGLGRYALLAHDSGGQVARTVAARHGDRISGVVLGNTEIPRHHSWFLRGFVAALGTPLGRSALRLIMASRTARRSPIGYAGCFEDLDLLDGEFHELFVAPLLRDRSVAERQMQLLNDFDWNAIDELEETHRHITAPTLLIWGADDPFFPLAGAQAMTAQFPAGCELEVLRPGKLLVHEEQPAAFADLAIQFLKRGAN